MSNDVIKFDPKTMELVLQTRLNQLRDIGLLDLHVFKVEKMKSIRVNTLCNLCIDMMIDPNSLFEFSTEPDWYPKSNEDFDEHIYKLHMFADRLFTKAQVGNRLRHYRKLCELTGEEVAKVWTQYCTSNHQITQATVSNHERGVYSDLLVEDIITYINIYNTTGEIPPITLSDILFGCSFSSLCNAAFSNYEQPSFSYTNFDQIRPKVLVVNKNDKTLSEQQISHLISFSSIILRALLIKLTDSRCECCGIEAPFVGDDNIPFLMLHQIDPIKGNDLTNYVVLCPVCNAKITNLKDSELNKTLSDKAASHRLSDLFVSKNQ